MPKFLEDKLKREYGEKSAIPYKVMNSIGAMRGSKETAKGREMERKHEGDMKHNIREIRVEVHHGEGGKVTGHTVHHHMMPKKTKSPAFYEDTNESYPFDANGKSSSHGDMLNHIGKHLGLASATEDEHEPDGDENDEEEAG